MNRELDVVLLYELLDASKRRWWARGDYYRHSSVLRVVKVLAHAIIGVDLESDHPAADDHEPRGVDLLTGSRDLRGRRFVRKVHRLEVDVARAQRFRHLDRLRSREIPERVARNAQLYSDGPLRLLPR